MLPIPKLSRSSHSWPFILSAPATDLEIAHDFEAAEAGTSAYAPDYEEDALLHLATGEDSRLFGADFPVHLKIADEFFPLEDLPTEVQVARGAQPKDWLRRMASAEAILRWALTNLGVMRAPADRRAAGSR